MPKRTFAIDDELWKKFLEYLVKKYGTSKKARIELENAITEYLKRRQIIERALKISSYCNLLTNFSVSKWKSYNE